MAAVEPSGLYLYGRWYAGLIQQESTLETAAISCSPHSRENHDGAERR